VLTAQLVRARQHGLLGDADRALAISRETADTSLRFYGQAHQVTKDAYRDISLWKTGPAQRG